MLSDDTQGPEQTHLRQMEWAGRFLLIAGVAFVFVQLAIDVGLAIWSRISGPAAGSAAPTVYSVGLLIVAAGVGLIVAAGITRHVSGRG